jgi:hypothetical protein
LQIHRWQNNDGRTIHAIDTKINTWLEETPAIFKQPIFLSTKDRAMLVNRCNKRLQERGMTSVALSKQVGIPKHQVS